MEDELCYIVFTIQNTSEYCEAKVQGLTCYGVAQSIGFADIPEPSVDAEELELENLDIKKKKKTSFNLSEADEEKAQPNGNHEDHDSASAELQGVWQLSIQTHRLLDMITLIVF